MHCLLGRFLTDRAINFNIIRSRMASIWHPGKGVNIREINTRLYLFQFFHLIDLKRILEGGPWTFDNQLLILHKLKPGDIPTSIPLFSGILGSGLRPTTRIYVINSWQTAWGFHRVIY